MKKMSSAAFRARCLSVIDEVQRSKQPVLIIKNRKPFMRVLPILKRKEGEADLRAARKSTLSIDGRIYSRIVELE